MREYELTVVYDLAVAEAGGPEASVEHLETVVKARGGTVAKVDHWGRRRMAYPINRVIDGDYIVSRIEIDPTGVSALEASLQIDERIYRHLIVRADELPVPPPPREPRRIPGSAPDAPMAEAPAAAEGAVVTPSADAEVVEAAMASQPEAEAPVAVAAAPVAEAPVAEVAAPTATPEVAAPAAEETPAEAAPAAASKEPAE